MAKLPTFAELAAEYTWSNGVMPDRIRIEIASRLKLMQARQLVGRPASVKVWTQGGRHTGTTTMIETVKGIVFAVRDDDYIRLDTPEFGTLLLRPTDVFSINPRKEL